MKILKFASSAVLIMLSHFAFAQTGQWKLTGNSLNGTQKLGSTNNSDLNFFTNNIARMVLTRTGNLNIISDQSSIQFPNPGDNPKPMMFMFPSGQFNTSRMIIAHSPLFPNYGLEYSDVNDRFDFLSNGSSIFNVDLANSRVGVNSAFNVTGTSAFSGNVGIGTISPEANLHVSRGSAGVVSGYVDAPLVVENSTHSYVNLLSPSNRESGILFGNPTSNVDGGIIYNNTANPKGFQFRTSTNTTRMVLTGNGLLGVGTTTPQTDMHIRYGADFGGGDNGLRIENTASGSKHWTFETFSNGDLGLFSTFLFVGIFDRNSGDYSFPSDARMKKDIEKAPDILDKVMRLDIKKYHFLESKADDKKHYGMIAQDVEKIFPEVVHHNILNSGKQDVYTMSYSTFGVIALKAIQEQQKKIEEQEKTNHQQQRIIEKQQITIEKLQSDMEDLKRITGLSPGTTNQPSAISKETTGLPVAHLNQNTPNPFSAATIIGYYLPETKQNAAIEVVSSNGQLIKTFPLTQKGNGQLSIKAGELSAGTYYYVLKVDGAKIDSKQMMLTK
ncbi:MAG TPA: tail fiber domain-containing protein [Chitinophagaceae bacterium]|jgi:hypothetical protein